MDHSIIQYKSYKNSQTPQFSKKGNHKVNHNIFSYPLKTNNPRNSEKGALGDAHTLDSYHIYQGTHYKSINFKSRCNERILKNSLDPLNTSISRYSEKGALEDAQTSSNYYSYQGNHCRLKNSNSLNHMNTSIPRNSEKGALEGAQALYKCYDTHGRPKHFELKGNNFKYISNSVQVPQDMYSKRN